MRAAGVFHDINMSVSVIASTTGDSGDVEMSPSTTRTVAVACPSWLRATTVFTMVNISDELNYHKFIIMISVHPILLVFTFIKTSIRWHGWV